MRLTNAFKTVCDFLFYFSFAALFKFFSGSWLLMGSVIALGFVSSLIMQKANGILPVRIICGLLPFAGLFVARSISDIVIASIVISFYAVITFADKNNIQYEEYKFWFGIPAVPVTVMFLICFGKWPIRPESTVLAALYLFLGIFVLRSKRLGEGARFKHRLMNLAELSAALAFGVLVCIIVYEIVMHSGKIFEVIAMPFGGIFLLLISIASGLFDAVYKPNTNDRAFLPKDPDVKMVERQETVENAPDLADYLNYDVIEVIIVVFMILLAVLILVLLLRWFYSMLRRLDTKTTGAYLEIEDGKGEKDTSFFGFRRKKKKPHTESNNAKMRQIYKEYLFFVKTFGVKIVNQTTSEEVAIASDEIIENGMSDELRQLYIRARYNDQQLSDEELQRAKDLFKDIREQIEDKMR